MFRDCDASDATLTTFKIWYEEQIAELTSALSSAKKLDYQAEQYSTLRYQQSNNGSSPIAKFFSSLVFFKDSVNASIQNTFQKIFGSDDKVFGLREALSNNGNVFRHTFIICHLAPYILIVNQKLRYHEATNTVAEITALMAEKDRPGTATKIIKLLNDNQNILHDLYTKFMNSYEKNKSEIQAAPAILDEWCANKQYTMRDPKFFCTHENPTETYLTEVYEAWYSEGPGMHDEAQELTF